MLVSVVYPPADDAAAAAWHKCESLRRNFHFDSFTAGKGGREEGRPQSPASFSLPLSLQGWERYQLASHASPALPFSRCCNLGPVHHDVARFPLEEDCSLSSRVLFAEAISE